jgi:hypothetical protein
MSNQRLTTGALLVKFCFLFEILIFLGFLKRYLRGNTSEKATLQVVVCINLENSFETFLPEMFRVLKQLIVKLMIHQQLQNVIV